MPSESDDDNDNVLCKEGETSKDNLWRVRKRSRALVSLYYMWAIGPCTV